MPSPFTNSVIVALQQNADLQSALGASVFDSSLPAIYSTDPAPENLNRSLPWLIVSGHVADVPFDQKGFEGRDIDIDIRCYTNRTGSVNLVDDVAEKVRRALHRQNMPVVGYDWIETQVTGPVVLDSVDTYGRILTVNLLYAGQ